MLKEALNVRQVPGDPPRRWFSDDYFDLIVWLDADGSFWGFQLCYDIGDKPRALTWTKTHAYKHTGIDDGEHAAGNSKSSPVLVNDGLFDAAAVGRRFEAASASLPGGMAGFVLGRIKEFRL